MPPPDRVALNSCLVTTLRSPLADAGCLQSPSPRKSLEGQFAIELDVAKGLACALAFELDARCVGNESRFINDYRGLAAHPNVKFHTMAHAGRGMWVDIIVVAAIRAGDEILVDYGADFASYASDAHTTASCRALKVARKRPTPR